MTPSLEALVSQETLEKFKIYESLLREWNRRTALVQHDTLSDFDNRHILDSLQLIPIIETNPSPLLLKASPLNQPETLIPENLRNLDQPSSTKNDLSFLDVGTGAGFPGMVLAMCGFRKINLCESNQKKCFFLEEVARQTDTPVTLIKGRVENIDKIYDVMLSRACTDLNNLCETMSNIISPSGYALFHKGRTWQKEVEFAQQKWNFGVLPYKSITSEESVLLYLYHLKKSKF